MGINIPANSSLGIEFFSIISFFFVLANMNLTVFAGILLAVTLATARRASLGEKTMQAAGKADEPGEAARLARLVEKIMRAADEVEKPDEAKRESEACKDLWETCNNDDECCGRYCEMDRASGDYFCLPYYTE